MDELCLKEMSARNIVDLKLIYESTKHFHKQLLKIQSILENQYIPLNSEHSIQFSIGILFKKTKTEFQQILSDLSSVNSELWENSELTIDLASIVCIDIYYHFNGKDIHTNIGNCTTTPFTFMNIFKEMVDKIKISFDFYFAYFDQYHDSPDYSLSIFFDAINYLPITSTFLESIDEKDLNKHFEKAILIVEQQNAKEAERKAERILALENITKILNNDLISFVQAKAGINYPEDLILEALAKNFK